eukprot:gene6840-9510_t
MGRKKITIQPIKDTRNRQVTLNKRKIGLMKKAYELSVLCDCEIALIIMDSDNRRYLFGSHEIGATLRKFTEDDIDPIESHTNTTMQELIERRSCKPDTQSNEDGDDDGCDSLNESTLTQDSTSVTQILAGANNGAGSTSLNVSRRTPSRQSRLKEIFQPNIPISSSSMANGSLPNSEAVKKIEKQGVLAAPSAKSITYQDKTYKEKDYTHQPMSSSFSDVTKHTLMHDPMSTPIPSVLNIDHINESQDNETPNLHVSIPTPGTLQQHLPTWLKPDSGSSLPVRRAPMVHSPAAGDIAISLFCCLNISETLIQIYDSVNLRSGSDITCPDVIGVDGSRNNANRRCSLRNTHPSVSDFLYSPFTASSNWINEAFNDVRFNPIHDPVRTSHYGQSEHSGQSQLQHQNQHHQNQHHQQQSNEHDISKIQMEKKREQCLATLNTATQYEDEVFISSPSSKRMKRK